MPVPPPAPGPVYYAPPQPFTGWPAPRRKVWPLVVVVSVVVGLVVVGGLFAMAADVYAKNAVCTSLPSINNPSSGSSNSSSNGDRGDAAPDPGKLHKETDQVRTLAKMLFFHSSLKHAVNGMADDVDHILSLSDQMKTVSSPEDAQAVMAQIPAIQSSIDLHVREAQGACGQKETGILSGN